MNIDQIRKLRIYKNLEEYSREDNDVRYLISVVERIISECISVTKAIIKYMPEYTLHDEVHVISVMELMDRLLDDRILGFLSPLELSSLLLSAALHDIGMAPPKEEVDILLKGNSTSSNIRQIKYKAFRESYPLILKRQLELRYQNRFHETEELEAYLLSLYIRQTHGERTKEFIHHKYKNELKYSNFDFTTQIADVCYSHSQDTVFLERLPCFELVRSPGEYVNWRFIAVILRLADILDFDAARTPSILFENLGIRNKISYQEWEKHRSVQAWDIKPDRIAFSARCPDPLIEKCIRDFIHIIENELSLAKITIANMHDLACTDITNKYLLKLPSFVDIRDVGPVQDINGPIYNYVDLGFHLDAESVMSLVMGINLYGNRLLFLRELIQNAVDTCRFRAALHSGLTGSPAYSPSISIELVQKRDEWKLYIEDNGMGMDEKIVKENFARIGKSYYKSSRFYQEKIECNISFNPISTFGIGVLSVFMVTNKLKISTRKLNNNLFDLENPLDIEIDGTDGIFWFRRSKRVSPGTLLELTINDPGVIKISQEYPYLESHVAQSEKDKSLFKTIALLAPHIEFPMSVFEQGVNKQLESEWIIPHFHTFYPKLYRRIDIDLTSDGPVGLDGNISIFLLQNELGSLSTEVELTEEQYYSEILMKDLVNRLEQKCGYIEHIHVECSEKERRVTEGFSTSHRSEGRWTQQGFYVEQPLFGQNVRNYSTIQYPFVVYYDVNLSGDFVLNLTVDRLRIIDDTKFKNVRRNITNIVTTLLLNKLGSEEVLKSRQFFEETINVIDDNVVKEAYGNCLKTL